MVTLELPATLTDVRVAVLPPLLPPEGAVGLEPPQAATAASMATVIPRDIIRRRFVVLFISRFLLTALPPERRPAATSRRAGWRFV